MDSLGRQSLYVAQELLLLFHNSTFNLYLDLGNKRRKSSPRRGFEKHLVVSWTDRSYWQPHSVLFVSRCRDVSFFERTDRVSDKSIAQRVDVIMFGEVVFRKIREVFSTKAKSDPGCKTSSITNYCGPYERLLEDEISRLRRFELRCFGAILCYCLKITGDAVQFRKKLCFWQLNLNSSTMRWHEAFSL